MLACQLREARLPHATRALRQHTVLRRPFHAPLYSYNLSYLFPEPVASSQRFPDISWRPATHSLSICLSVCLFTCLLSVSLRYANPHRCLLAKNACAVSTFWDQTYPLPALEDTPLRITHCRRTNVSQQCCSIALLEEAYLNTTTSVVAVTAYFSGVA